MRNVLKKFVEKIETDFTFQEFFSLKIVKFMRKVKNLVQPERPQTTV
jgi:hypothetical protein